MSGCLDWHGWGDYSADMQTPGANESNAGGALLAIGGLLVVIIGGFFLAQAGGGDRETFLFVGFLLIAVGFLGMLIGGVAIGIQMARR
jgi:cation transporter-like permease